MKFIVWGIFSLLCGILMLIPEMGMYFIWHLLNPQTDLYRLGLIAIFVFGGGGLSFLFAILGIGLWGSGTQAIL